MSIVVENKFDGSSIEAPEHIVDRTENILGMTPMTNQRIIIDLAQWWLENCGNCPIYRYCVHRLDNLENDDVTAKFGIYDDAQEQAEQLGFNV
jgi:hypothetical protein